MKKTFLFLSLIVVLILIIAVCIYNFIGSWSAVKNAPAKEPIAAVDKNISPEKITPNIQLKKILIHKNSLADLGINFTRTAGNSADIYLSQAGDSVRGIYGDWANKYSDPFSHLIPIAPEDQKLILEMAGREKFSFYPEEAPLPDSVLEINNRRIFSLILIRYMAYAATTTALELEKNGQKDEAEKILQAFVAIGRQMEDSFFNSDFQFLTGNIVEKIAAKGLLDFYNRNGDSAKALKFQNYIVETELLRGNIKNSYNDPDMMKAAVGIYSFGSLRAAKAAMAATGESFPDNISESEFGAWLDSLKFNDDQIIQTDLLLPLLYLKNASGASAESAKAIEILQQYSQSQNQYVAKYAKNALEISKEEFARWAKGDQ